MKIAISLFIAALVLSGGCAAGDIDAGERGDSRIELPEPSVDGGISLNEAIKDRRSRRRFAPGSLSLEEISLLLWAAQGETDPRGKRAAPSAGALYPLEVYLVAADVEGLETGVYRYRPEGHLLKSKSGGDARESLAAAALGQSAVSSAPADILIAAEYARTTKKYGKRGIRYVHMEAGHAAQNVYLECENLGLATVTIGAFRDAEVKEALGTDFEPLYIMPVGRAEE